MRRADAASKGDGDGEGEAAVPEDPGAPLLELPQAASPVMATTKMATRVRKLTGMWDLRLGGMIPA
jgi:hypothetical protein